MNSRDTYPDKVFRFCPSCGAEGFAVAGGFSPGAAGNHKFLCGSCGFTFYINASVGTAAYMVNKRNELLLVKRRREPKLGMLDLPGGFAAPGEPAEDALKREVLEEVNLPVTECTPWEKSYCNEYSFGGITYFTTDFIYICRTDRWDLLNMADPTEAEPVLVPFDEIDITKIGFPSLQKAVHDILQSKKYG